MNVGEERSGLPRDLVVLESSISITPLHSSTYFSAFLRMSAWRQQNTRLIVSIAGNSVTMANSMCITMEIIGVIGVSVWVVGHSMFNIDGDGGVTNGAWC